MGIVMEAFSPVGNKDVLAVWLKGLILVIS